MRKIEQQMIQAIRDGRNWHGGNTLVTNEKRTDGGLDVYLHANRIATRASDGNWAFTLASWPTPTTRSRINALMREVAPGAGVFQRGGKQFMQTGDAAPREIGSSEWFMT